MYALSLVAIVAAIAGALILPHVDVSVFRTGLAVLTLAAIPLIFVTSSRTKRLADKPILGFAIASLLLVIGSVINGSAISILFTLTIMSFFDMSVMRVTALRRFVGIGQSVTLFVILTAQGFLIWQHALPALVGSSIGSYVGTKFAIKRGELFAKYALAIIAVISSFALLLGV